LAKLISTLGSGKISKSVKAALQQAKNAVSVAIKAIRVKTMVTKKPKTKKAAKNFVKAVGSGLSKLKIFLKGRKVGPVVNKALLTAKLAIKKAASKPKAKITIKGKPVKLNKRTSM